MAPRCVELPALHRSARSQPGRTPLTKLGYGSRSGGGNAGTDDCSVRQLDRARWQRANDRIIPENMRLLPHLAHSPALHAVEQRLDAVREQALHNRVVAVRDRWRPRWWTGCAN